jgi:hypothetical protein
MVDARRWVRLMMADVSDSMVVVVCGIGSVWGCRIGREVLSASPLFVGLSRSECDEEIAKPESEVKRSAMCIFLISRYLQFYKYWFI